MTLTIKQVTELIEGHREAASNAVDAAERHAVNAKTMSNTFDSSMAEDAHMEIQFAIYDMLGAIHSELMIHSILKGVN
jgi:hypothetical protein